MTRVRLNICIRRRAAGLLGLLVLAGAANGSVGGDKYLPAFPGAEGFGGYARGGRGGTVLAVESLDDYDASRGEAPIAGTFRHAVESRGRRTIVFRVSGTIFLKRALSVSHPYLTIAGQTAPGDGICIARHMFSVNADEVIIRHMRFRLGDEARAEMGTFQVQGAQNVIIDHCSFSWSMDENCTFHGGTARNLTLQWSLISESLNRSYHPKGEHGHGSLLRSDDGGFTVHHCIYAHNNSRNPRPGGYEDQPGLLLDFRNNIVYDWGAISGYSGLERTRLNYVGNYFKPGPSTKAGARDYGFTARTFRTKLFWTDNFFPGDTRKNAENWDMIRKDGDWEGALKETNLVPEPFPAPAVVTEPAEQAYVKVLAQAGATLPRRDSVDARVVGEIQSGGGRIIDSQDDVGGWPTLQTSPAPADKDKDGMPDSWEERCGFDPARTGDGSRDADKDGYTNLEEFLNNTDPHVSDHKQSNSDIAGILAKLADLNFQSHKEIAEEKRTRPEGAGTDGSAPPPIRRIEVIRSTLASAQPGAKVALTPDLELQLALIPAGAFSMGSPESEPERKRDERDHKVIISQPFYMGVTPVTCAEYQSVTGGKSHKPRKGDLPVEVSWPDAVRFCQALSRNTSKTFRLPTEAEWEYACRAGTTTPFNTGPTISTDQANYDGKFVYPGGKAGIYRGAHLPVGTFEPNAWGLYDMHGNAYQWCSDWYGPYAPGPVTDPKGPASGHVRVIRGGKYGSGPRYLRSAARYSYTPNNSSVVFGFRVVMELEAGK